MYQAILYDILHGLHSRIILVTGIGPCRVKTLALDRGLCNVILPSQHKHLLTGGAKNLVKKYFPPSLIFQSCSSGSGLEAIKLGQLLSNE